MVRLMGGLGNQMFQYAYGRALSVKYKTELVLDFSLLEDRSASHEIVTHRDFALSVFSKLQYRKATQAEVIRFNGAADPNLLDRISYKWRRWSGNIRLFVQNNNEWDPNLGSIGNDTCVVGRFQSELFFKGVSVMIRDEFSTVRDLPEEVGDLGKELSQIKSLAVHVRRGDLVSSPMYSKQIGALETGYYRRALALVNEKAVFDKILVFSDDPEWCKQNLGIANAEFAADHLSGPFGVWHLYLMSKCRSQIISNSTFSWWAAWLNNFTQKVVIGPKEWYREERLRNPYIFPPEWIGV